jgi:hypothetical protein
MFDLMADGNFAKVKVAVLVGGDPHGLSAVASD